MNGSWHISVDFLVSRFWPFAVFLFAVFISIFSYRTTIPPLAKRIKILLIALRSLSLTFILLFCFQPLVKSIHRVDEKPKLVVLADHTESMRIQDSGVNRWQQAERLLNTPRIHDLENQYQVYPYTFDPALKPFPQNSLSDTISTWGKRTDLNVVLKSAAALNPGGILLLSDGRITEGEDPVVYARTLAFPIYSVCIGDPEIRPDSRIVRLTAPSIAYTGDSVSVILQTTQQGYAGQRSALRLLADGKVQAEKIIFWPQDGFEREDTLLFVPSTPGNTILTVEMAPQPGESIRANNRSSLSVEILKNKFRVLLLADAPSPDYALIKRLLESEKRFDLIGGAFKDANTLYDSTIRPDAWGEIDALILLNLPSATLSGPYRQALDRLFNQHKPFLLFTGSSFDPRALTELELTSPVTQFYKSRSRLAQLQLTPAGQAHAIFRNSFTDFSRMPPLMVPWSRIALRPGAQTLLQAGDTGRGIQIPIFVALQTSQSRNAVFAAEGFYRWTLLPNLDGRSLLSSLLTETVLWLCADESASNLRLHFDEKPIAGSPFHLTAEVYDEALKPLRGADVVCISKSAHVTDSLMLTETGSGLYEGNLSVPDAGRVSLMVKATWKGRKIGEVDKTVYFSERNAEFSDLRSDPELLADLAKATGGVSGPPDSLNAVLAHLNLPVREKEIIHSYALQHLSWLYILIILLLCTEWIIRKRLGMA